MLKNIAKKHKFKLATLLGIRPDYIRMHRLIKLLDDGQEKYPYEHLVVHSGQHYDPELYGIFLQELGIRSPDFDLGIGLELKKQGASNHAYQSALLSERVFEFIEKVKPDAIMYLGDTNTVLSAMTVARCGIPVIHIEGGGRSFDWRMPEEKNRIIIDHLSDALYSYLDRYKKILVSEGIDAFRITVVGNIIVDALNNFASSIDQSNILKILAIREKNFILMTLHREENIAEKNILKHKLIEVAKFGREKGLPIVFPLMPRTHNAIKAFGLDQLLNNDIFIKTKPLGFIDFVKLEKTARLTVSDSGTVQEESLILGTPSVICRHSTERPETMHAKATLLEGKEIKNHLWQLLNKAFSINLSWDRNILNPFGGSPSERIFDDLMHKITTRFFETSRDPKRLERQSFVREAYGQ